MPTSGPCTQLPPSARTYFASSTPHFFFGSFADAVWQRSIAFAPSIGTTSVSARLSSQGPSTLSTLPSQSSSAAGGTPPSASAIASTSIAPGFTLGSQSLQSPCATVKPSLSL